MTDEKIRELEARIAAYEDPAEEPFSKDPLVRMVVCHGHAPNTDRAQFLEGLPSPSNAQDVLMGEPDVPTDVESDDQPTSSGRK